MDGGASVPLDRLVPDTVSSSSSSPAGRFLNLSVTLWMKWLLPRPGNLLRKWDMVKANVKAMQLVLLLAGSSKRRRIFLEASQKDPS